MASALSFGGDGAFGQVISSWAMPLHDRRRACHPPSDGGNQRIRFVIRDDELYLEEDKSAYKRIGAAPRALFDRRDLNRWIRGQPRRISGFSPMESCRSGSTPEQSGRYSAARGP
jgi:hypothetical protein